MEQNTSVGGIEDDVNVNNPGTHIPDTQGEPSPPQKRIGSVRKRTFVIVALVAVIVIGALVGGLVGGLVHKNKPPNYDAVEAANYPPKVTVLPNVATPTFPFPGYDTLLYNNAQNFVDNGDFALYLNDWGEQDDTCWTSSYDATKINSPPIFANNASATFKYATLNSIPRPEGCILFQMVLPRSGSGRLVLTFVYRGIGQNVSLLLCQGCFFFLL